MSLELMKDGQWLSPLARQYVKMKPLAAPPPDPPLPNVKKVIHFYTAGSRSLCGRMSTEFSQDLQYVNCKRCLVKLLVEAKAKQMRGEK